MYSQWVNLKMLALQVHTCTVLINCIVLGFCRYLADCDRCWSCKMFLINIICTYMYECTQISNFSNVRVFSRLLFLTIHYMYSTGYYILTYTDTTIYMPKICKYYIYCSKYWILYCWINLYLVTILSKRAHDFRMPRSHKISSNPEPKSSLDISHPDNM